MKHADKKTVARGHDDSKVRSPKLAHLVAERLRERIAMGQIGPGDTLPSEAELVEEFGISRPTLREALRVLESETLIRLGRGSRTGATVLGPSIKAIAQQSTLYLTVQGSTMGELHEVRRLLEPPIAASLAGRSNKNFICAFEDGVRQLAEALERQDYASLLVGLDEFHNLLVKFSENRALSLVAGILHDISSQLHPQILLASHRRGQNQLFVKRCVIAVEAHGELTTMIAAGKSTQAEKLWRDYMGNVAEYLIQSGLTKLRVRTSPALH